MLDKGTADLYYPLLLPYSKPSESLLKLNAPHVLQDFVPFGAAALFPLTEKCLVYQSRARVLLNITVLGQAFITSSWGPPIGH